MLNPPPAAFRPTRALLRGAGALLVLASFYCAAGTPTQSTFTGTWSGYLAGAQAPAPPSSAALDLGPGVVPVTFTVDALGVINTGLATPAGRPSLEVRGEIHYAAGDVTGFLRFMSAPAEMYPFVGILVHPGAGGEPNRAILGFDPTAGLYQTFADFSGGSPVAGSPAIAQPAAAAPNPVAGVSTALSVLGLDDGGEPALLYTWIVAAGPGVGVTFSPNGTNGAQAATATFSAAGVYTLRAIVTDADGLTATSQVTVTVERTLLALEVQPATVELLVGENALFRAFGTDQFGLRTEVPPDAWSVSGGGGGSGSGTITPGGVLTAANAGGPFTVTAQTGALSAAASFSVTANAPPVLGSVNATPNPAHVFAGVQFSAAASDPEGRAIVYTWDFGDGAAASGALALHVYTASGVYAASVRAGDGANEVTAALEITVLDPQARLTFGTLQALLQFKRAERDAAKLKATVAPLPFGFLPAGRAVTLDVAGARVQFILDARGKAKSAQGTVALRFTRSNWTLQANLKHGAWAALWAAYGMTNADVRGASVTLPVTLVLDGQPFRGERPLTYRARQGGTGKAK